MRARIGGSDPAALAEALYNLRRAREMLADRRAAREMQTAARDALAAADRELSAYAREVGFEPGESAAAADAAKLVLVHAHALVDHTRVRELDTSSAALERAARAEGSDCKPLNVVLGRVCEFMARWVYARTLTLPDGRVLAALMEDDPHLPVGPWLEARGGPPQDWDLPAWVALYEQWQAEAFAVAFPLLASARGARAAQLATRR